MSNLEKYWSNIIQGKYFIKGKNDSKTIKKVLAHRDGNKFAPDICYFDFKENLEVGEFYVDCEE